MSTLVEIQDAVGHLPGAEQEALKLWLNSRAAVEPTGTEEQRLLHSLDQALRDLDAGKGVPITDVRNRVASWAAK